MPKKFPQAVLAFANLILFAISPMALIGLLVGIFFGLLSGYGQHSMLLQRLEEHGRVTQGVVSYLSTDRAWLFVDFVDDEGRERSGEMELHYYAPEVAQDLKEGTRVTIRYLPYERPGSGHLILQERYDQVRDYRGYASPETWIVVLVCWAIVLLKPQSLFVGLVEFDRLIQDGVTL